jgi:hypothetical protein
MDDFHTDRVGDVLRALPLPLSIARFPFEDSASGPTTSALIVYAPPDYRVHARSRHAVGSPKHGPPSSASCDVLGEGWRHPGGVLG